MKPNVSPADVRNIREALSRLSVAQQWVDIVTSVGVDMTESADRIAANRRILEGLLSKVEPLVGGIS